MSHASNWCTVPDGPPCGLTPEEPISNFGEITLSNPYYFPAMGIKVVCPTRVPENLTGMLFRVI